MKRTILVLCLLLAVATAFGDVTTTFGQVRPPNIVLVLIDDYGWADSTSYGSTYHRTPNIDALATRGMRFTDAYAAGPVCSPTRAALMTGKHPARLHLTDWLPGRRATPAQKMAVPTIRQQLPLEETTMAEALKTGGYASAHIGGVDGMRLLPLLTGRGQFKRDALYWHYPHYSPQSVNSRHLDQPGCHSTGRLQTDRVLSGQPRRTVQFEKRSE